MFRSLGVPELILILAVVLLLFGVGRVTKVGQELGSAISAFRKGLKEDDAQPADADNKKKEA